MCDERTGGNTSVAAAMERFRSSIVVTCGPSSITNSFPLHFMRTRVSCEAAISLPMNDFQMYNCNRTYLALLLTFTKDTKQTFQRTRY